MKIGFRFMEYDIFFDARNENESIAITLYFQIIMNREQ